MGQGQVVALKGTGRPVSKLVRPRAADRDGVFQLEAAICRDLGLDPSLCKDVTLELHTGDWPMVTIRRQLTQDEADRLAVTLDTFHVIAIKVQAKGEGDGQE